jgi:hypothetical protein
MDDRAQILRRALQRYARNQTLAARILFITVAACGLVPLGFLVSGLTHDNSVTCGYESYDYKMELACVKQHGFPSTNCFEGDDYRRLDECQNLKDGRTTTLDVPQAEISTVAAALVAQNPGCASL